jgi:hypothetical protein
LLNRFSRLAKAVHLQQKLTGICIEE